MERGSIIDAQIELEEQKIKLARENLLVWKNMWTKGLQIGPKKRSFRMANYEDMRLTWE